jgi:hypothetical protein
LYFDALERAFKVGLIGQDDRDTLLALLNLAKYLCGPKDNEPEHKHPKLT